MRIAIISKTNTGTILIKIVDGMNVFNGSVYNNLLFQHWVEVDQIEISEEVKERVNDI